MDGAQWQPEGLGQFKINSAETAATNEDLVLLAAASCSCTTNTQESYTKNGRTLGPNQEKV